MDNQFFIKSDDTFQAYLGDVILKAKKVGETEGWHFEAVCSTPDNDREGETLLQKGLNFEPFMDSGEFNWNHIPHAMVGVPCGKKAWFSKGNWHCEGVLLKDMPIAPGYTTNQVVQQHNQLRKAQTNRGLCTSVEGKVRQRSKCGKYVQKADIYNIAVTFRPVNPNCTLQMIAKSMDGGAELAIQDAYYEAELAKALSATGASAFTKEDLEGSATPSLGIEGKLKKHLMSKGYSEKDATKYVNSYFKKRILGAGSK